MHTEKRVTKNNLNPGPKPCIFGVGTSKHRALKSSFKLLRIEVMEGAGCQVQGSQSGSLED